MKRLLIVGSREFIVSAMDVASTYAPGLTVLGMVDTAISVEDVRQTRPDIVVVDGTTDPSGAVASLSDLREQAPEARWVVVVDEPEPDDVELALDAGAVVWAQPPGVRTGLRKTRLHPRENPLRSVTPRALGDARDRPVLTRREHEIMRWVAAGHANATIARGLWVTEQTVKFHLTNIYRKLGVANRTEATQYATQHGLLPQSARPQAVGAEVRPRTLQPVADTSAVSG